MARLTLVLLFTVTTACASGGQRWSTLETPYARFDVDTTSLYTIEGRYAVARMRANTRSLANGTWDGQGELWQFDFDCYLMQWRPTDRARDAANGAVGWFSLNHNLLDMPPHVWRRLGDEYGAFPFSYVCQEAGLIDDNGDFTGQHQRLSPADTTSAHNGMVLRATGPVTR